MRVYICLKVHILKKRVLIHVMFKKNRKCFSSNICDMKESARQLCSQLIKSLTNLEYV